MEKHLIVIDIKSEMKEAYINIHLNPWQDMLKAIKDSGFINELIWFHETQSIIYIECEDGRYDVCNQKLRSTEICKKWDKKIIPWFKSEPVMPQLIFDLNPKKEKKEKR